MKTQISPWIVIVIILLLAGSQQSCSSDAERQQKIAEANAKIARHCTPELGEERVLRWTVNAEGHYVLYVSIRQPIGRKGNVAQFVVVSEDEIQ